LDKKTLDAYNSKATEYVNTWLSQPTPLEIHDLVKTYFLKDKPTADIGCGSGREVAWLNESGYPAIGFDASKSLISIAKKQFPNFKFLQSALPKLVEIPNQAYANVLCETVIMHLPKDEIAASVQSLFRILKHHGVLSLSWRLSANAENSRESDGRLYTQIEFSDITSALVHIPNKVLYQNETLSASSGKTIRQMVFKKLDS